MVKLLCRLFGHRYRCPLIGCPVHVFVPDAATPPGRLVGVCSRCGDEWRWS